MNILPMSIIVTYRVDKELYHANDAKHNLLLVTTEYRYRNELLVHVLIGKNLGIRLNDRLSDLRKGTVIRNEQFLFKKTYRQDKPKLITRDTFYSKLKRFDMSQTVTEREILEEYTYTDKNNRHDHVQIVMVDACDTVVATIDFADSAQYENFISPVWLVRSEPQ